MNKTAQTSTLKHEAGDRNKLVLHCYSTVQVYTAFLAETKKTTEKTEAFYTLSKVRSEQICFSLKHFGLGLKAWERMCTTRRRRKGEKKTEKKEEAGTIKACFGVLSSCISRVIRDMSLFAELSKKSFV